jgi:signal peptidase I
MSIIAIIPKTCLGLKLRIVVSSLRVADNFEKRYRLVREIVETVVLTVLMFVIINLAVQNYDVTGPSMEPSLHNQERIMVDKVSYLFHAPTRGDVIVFIAPPAPSDNYVKRIIGIPGDVITVSGDTVTLDGVTLNETYVDPAMQGNSNAPIINKVLPAGQYFVMGDDRRNSSDSRVWGLVPRGNIIGRAALVYWPLGQDNSGFLPNVSSVFAKVHQSTDNKTALAHPSAQTRASFSSTHLSVGMDETVLGGTIALTLLFPLGRKRKLKQEKL